MTNILKRIKALEARQRIEIGAYEASQADIRPHIAPVYYELLDDIEAGKHSIYNLPGGRGSCKSSFVSLVIVKGLMADPTGKSSAIVFRHVGETLRDSVFTQIGWAIEQLGVGHLWDCTTTPMKFQYFPTGAEIVFRGLDKPAKLKSIKPRRGSFRYVWLEEFSELPGDGFTRSVMQSVVRGSNGGAVVFRSFNPPVSQNNWANQLVRQPDVRAVTLLTNYTQVPPEWLGEDFIYEAERLKQINPKAYEHEYLGLPVGTGGEVFPNLDIREITQDEIDGMGYLFQGLDFGFMVDPACFLRVAYDRKHETIFLLDEIYELRWSNQRMADEIKARGYDRWAVTADSAEPKSIADLRDAGIQCVPCTKWPGCVQYRVKWLQHRKIVIDPARTPNAYREFTGYAYPVDKNGNLLSVLPDKDNHTIDSLVYSLNTIIARRNNLA